MSTKEAIQKGIGAHGMWKQRLIQAIDTGQSEWTPEIVCQDNQCEFGKWLYSCSPEERTSEYYNEIKKLHAEFHVTAADVLKMALAGNKDEAEKSIGDGSKYKQISGTLIKHMMLWSASFNN